MTVSEKRDLVEKNQVLDSRFNPPLRCVKILKENIECIEGQAAQHTIF